MDDDDLPIIALTLDDLKALCKERQVVIRVGSRAAKIVVEG